MNSLAFVGVASDVYEAHSSYRVGKHIVHYGWRRGAAIWRFQENLGQPKGKIVSLNWRDRV